MKQLLRLRALLRGDNAGMVGDGAIAIVVKDGRPLLAGFARQRIDDAASPVVAIQKCQQLIAGVGLWLDGQADVRPVKARNMNLRLPAKQPLQQYRAAPPHRQLR